mgnify:CR=1 FL=1
MKKIVFYMLCCLLCFSFVTGCGKSKKENDKKIMKDLTNYTLSEIEAYAKENNLKLNINYQNSTEKKDALLSQSIKAGSNLEGESKLEIVLSSGRLDDSVYKENNVNELGRVPVMMYHGIHNKKNSETNYTGGNVDKDGYQRTSEAFYNDLEYYYQNGYRMIRLQDYINGNIDVELGKSPIVITFDDSLKNNIIVTGLDKNGDIIIDPNSAVGILEQFKKKYPDYNVTATFFVNATLFEQPEYTEKILKWLVDNGYDIGNHTYSHVNFKNASANESIEEVATLYQLLDKYIPGKYVNIVALPFGSPGSSEHANFKHILSGNYNGYEYHTDSTLRVGWEADYSPFSPLFNKVFIKRIRAYDNNGNDFDIEYNFKVLENERYISDGNPDNVVVSKDYLKYITNADNFNVISY